jgi:two-component system cell cycle response regulator
VLVIEDNDVNLELMTYLLRAGGYDTDVARDGATGLARMRQGGLDLVICDIQLPGLDGLRLVRAFRDEFGAAGPPVIAVTAFAQAGDREKILSAGFDGYLSKPIEPEIFVGQIGAFLPEARRAAVGGKETAATPVVAEVRAPVGGLRVLVVDDTAANVELMRGLLEPFGHLVHAASGVTDALADLVAAVPHLIVSDVHLRDGTGYELLSIARRDGRLRDVPFVILSSTARTPQERERCLSLGARAFIVRPIEAGDLLAELRPFLSERT